jgi:hypothetical protein
MQFKKGDAHILAAVAGGMTNATLPIEVQVVGYSLLTDLVGCLGVGFGNVSLLESGKHGLQKHLPETVLQYF